MEFNAPTIAVLQEIGLYNSRLRLVLMVEWEGVLMARHDAQ